MPLQTAQMGPQHEPHHLGHAVCLSRNGKVRADQAYNSVLGSSLFDYTNMTAEGLVWNALWEVRPNVKAEPKIWTGYVLPAFPLWKNNTLAEMGAVFMGVIEDPDMETVATVSCALFLCFICCIYITEDLGKRFHA